MSNEAKKFWAWFKEHNTSYINLDDIDEDSKEQLLDKLLDHLHEYCDQLYFEIGGAPEKNQQLIITAEGKVDFFDQVEKLVNDAPVIDNWSFLAFIQPQTAENTVNFEDVELKPGEMWFLPLQGASNPASIGIRVCTPTFDLVKDSKWFKSADYKVLDTVLDEKSAALDVNHIDFGKLPDGPAEKGLIELAELPAYIKWKKAGSFKP